MANEVRKIATNEFRNCIYSITVLVPSHSFL